MTASEPRTEDRPHDGAPVGATAEPAAAESGVQQFRATARRAPKVGVFLVLGGLLGAIVAAILSAVRGAGPTQTGDGGGAVSDNGVWIFVIYFFAIAIGVALGGLVALILDRVSRRRASLVTVERGLVEREPEPAASAEPDAGPDAEPATAPSPEGGAS